ncbi:Histone-lysine N-methyltransferase SETMAR, partial [Habropoda laboriosa]
PYVASRTVQKLHQRLPHPSFSPDLSPIDLHFFRSLDTFLTQKPFEKQEDIENTFHTLAKVQKHYGNYLKSKCFISMELYIFLMNSLKPQGSVG